MVWKNRPTAGLTASHISELLAAVHDRFEQGSLPGKPRSRTVTRSGYHAWCGDGRERGVVVYVEHRPSPRDEFYPGDWLRIVEGYALTLRRAGLHAVLTAGPHPVVRITRAPGEPRAQF